MEVGHGLSHVVKEALRLLYGEEVGGPTQKGLSEGTTAAIELGHRGCLHQWLQRKS